MTEIVIEAHRRKIPIDHPDGSITTEKIADESIVLTKFEHTLAIHWTPAVDRYNRPLMAITEYGLAITSVLVSGTEPAITCVTPYNVGVDAHIRSLVLPSNRGGLVLRVQGQWGDVNCYLGGYISLPDSTEDHKVYRRYNGSWTMLASESVDLSNVWHDCVFSISGSTLKSSRTGGDTFQIIVTDTYISEDGRAGLRHSGTPDHPSFIPKSIGLPYTELPKARIIIECEIEGSGKSTEDGIRPKIATELRFSKELGKNIDLSTITWGAFDYRNENTMFICVYRDNVYKEGAIERQIEYAKSKGLKVLKPPKDIQDAKQVLLELKRHKEETIAGVHNLAYQCLGYSDLEPLAVADFYDGYYQGIYNIKSLEKSEQFIKNLCPKCFSITDKETHCGEKTLPNAIIQYWLIKLDKSRVSSIEKEKHAKKLKRLIRC